MSLDSFPSFSMSIVLKAAATCLASAVVGISSTTFIDLTSSAFDFVVSVVSTFGKAAEEKLKLKLPLLITVVAATDAVQEEGLKSWMPAHKPAQLCQHQENNPMSKVVLATEPVLQLPHSQVHLAQ